MADEFTQANRRLRIETPLGPDALLLTALSGTEGVSTLFHFQAELLGRDEQADFDAVVGKNVTISIASSGGPRFLNGIVSRLVQSGTAGDHPYFRAEIVPWLWFLTRTSDCRVFQKKSVPEIVQQLFGEYGFSDFRLRLKGTHETWDYCVQYRETDYNFIARLLEEEGIFYFFEHENGKHTLVLANAPDACPACPILSSVRFMHEQSATTVAEDVITWFTKEQELRPGKWCATDYNFESPSLDLQATAIGNDDRGYEIYDYPIGSTTRDRCDRLVRVRQEEEDATRVVSRGAGYARSFTPGFHFTMRAEGERVSSRFDGRYVLTAVQHRASESYGAGPEGAAVSYENDFECIDAAVQFRPPRHTRKPVIFGVQTALVVGPGGEEIFVDKYGRVKVQFYWDREGKKDEHSSCWVRISQDWAGKNWGIVTLPRIGQEVIVSFLEGDPDRPIVTGRVYNAEQMPPYALPEHATQSGIKTRSSKGGGLDNFNEIRFEDKKGAEELYIHAERNQTIVVETDKSETVGHDETITVENDRTETVNGNETLAVAKDRKRTVSQNEAVSVIKNRSRKVGRNESVSVDGGQQIAVGGDRTITVGGDQTVTVKGDHQVSVEGDQQVAVQGDDQLQVLGDRTVDVAGDYSLKVGGNVVVDAGGSITLTTGGATIKMTSGGDVVVQGSKITVKGSGDVVIKGSKITQN